MTIHRFRSDPLFFLSVIGSVILLAGLAWPFFFGEIYASKDLGRFHIPVRWFYAQALENGDDWLWFPYGFGGYYVHGEGQGTLAHPLNWLGYRWLGFHSAFAIEFMRSWIFLVVGMFFLFRRLELARGAAAFGALLFSFCSFGFLHFGHLNFTGIVSHIPWVLIAADVALRSQRPRSIALARAALALLIASQLLHAHPQVAWMSLVLLAAFSAARLLERRKQIDSTGSWAIAKAVGGLALAVALGFVMAGIQLLPMLDGLEHSFRAAPGSGFLGMFALSPYESFQLFSPYLFHGRSHGLHLPERGFYAGAAVPPLIVWAAMRRKSLGPAARWWGWGMALAVIGFLLALGEKGLLHRLQQELPLVGLFRAPARFVLVAHLGLAVAAAVGFADLAKERTPVHRPPLRALWPLASVPLASLLVTGLALGVLHPVGNSTRVTSGLPGIAIGPVMALVASGLVAAAVHRPRLALSLLVLLTAADLGAYGLSHVHSYPPVELERWAELDVPPGIDPASRKELGPQKETMRGVRLAVGYAAMTPSRLLSFESRPFTPRARSVAVEGAHRQNALRVAAITESRDGPVEGALPRVRLVASTVATKSVPLMLSQIDPAEVALIEEDLMLPPGPRGDARLLEDRPGRIRIETNAPAERLLIVSERFHEGWRATSEGGGCRLIRVYGDFMGCVVPAGRSELELRFEPDSWRRGVWLSLIGLLATAVICAIQGRPWRAGPPRPSGHTPSHPPTGLRSRVKPLSAFADTTPMRVQRQHPIAIVALIAACLLSGCATKMTVGELETRLDRESRTVRSRADVVRVFPIHAQTKMEAWLVRLEAKGEPESSPSLQLGNGFRLGERRRVDYVVGGPFPELSEQIILNGLLLNEGRALRGLRIVLVSPDTPTAELRTAVNARRARLEHRVLD